jgi:hypothetical protein
MNHLTPDELIDAVEGTLDPARREHLASCEFCTREVAGLASVLTEARQVEMPEPSPLFWDHFSARVRTAVDNEANLARRSFGGGGWLRWPVLVPIGALALVTFVLMSAMPRQTGSVTPATTEAVAGDVALSDDGWILVADLVGDIDWDFADAAGVTVRPGLADQAALELNTQEQKELGRLIRAELERVKS